MKTSFVKIALFTALTAVTTVFTSCEEKTEVKTEINRPLGGELDLFWNLEANGYKGKSAYLSSFLLTNNSAKVLDSTGWAIYFHQPRRVNVETASENIKVTHINGDYFRIEPTASFTKLAPGQEVALSFESDAWAIKDVDAPNGLYIVFSDSAGVDSKPELITNVTYGPIVKPEQTNRFKNDPLPVPTPESRFEKNASLTFLNADSIVKILPTPFQYEATGQVYELKNGLQIAHIAELKNEAAFLAAKLKSDLGIDAKLIEGAKGDIVLTLGDVKVDGKSAEAYGLEVKSDLVMIEGADASGVFYGIQSLRSLIKAKDLAAKNGVAKIATVAVLDAPRFGYRGMHLDVARNFSKKETVLNLLDLMAFYKLNKFHFHITDDEGWRLEIPGLPELTDVGSKRGHSSDEAEMLNPAYGSGPHPDAETSWGTGFYTKAEFVEILKYATERHIEVIPELDFPGHARAAIISMKARQRKLIEAGKEAEANEYILHDPNDMSRYRSVQLYDDNVISVCQESTYRFLAKVTDEVVVMYEEAGLKLKQVHIGGDEVPHPTQDDPGHGAWKGSPKCNALLAADDDYSKSEQLFYYFVDRFAKILEDRGIVTAGWEEISLVKGEDEEGEPTVEQNEEFKERGFVPYVWNTVWGWGGEDRAYKLANAGFKVVLSNVTNNYFDLAYDKDPSDPGYYWGGFVDTKKAWQFVPLNVYAEQLTNRDGVPVDLTNYEKAVRLTDSGATNILGLQGQLWSETVKGNEMLEHYLFPKMLGMVERAWAQDPSWTSIIDDSLRFEAQDVDWNQFASRVGLFELPRLSFLNGGVSYRIAPVGIKVADSLVHINSDFPGVTIRYTTDGSEPTLSSKVYSEPFAAVTGTVKAVAFYTDNKFGPVSMVELK